jgi:hypothetical protein
LNHIGKAAWSVINCIEGHSKESTSIDALLIHDHKETDTQVIIDHLNKCFLEVPPNLDDIFMEFDDALNPLDLTFTLCKANEVEIVDIITKFQAKNS